MKSTFLILLLIGCSSGLFAQVGDIKDASSSNSSSGSGDSYDSDDYDYSSDDDGDGVIFDFLFGGIGEWQSHKLHEVRERYPSMVSFDVLLQGAIRPSSYYLVLPRIQGNYGLFGTDFRMNYLIEEGIEGYTHIRTNDWQIIQLNLVTSRFFTFRFGTGFMQESFGGKEAFSESTFMLAVHAPDQSKVLGFEFRTSIDWDTGVNPRREFSIQYQHQLFQANKLHGYASVGWVFQKYYNAINVWGIQGGLVLRFF